MYSMNTQCDMDTNFEYMVQHHIFAYSKHMISRAMYMDIFILYRIYLYIRASSHKFKGANIESYTHKLEHRMPPPHKCRRASFQVLFFQPNNLCTFVYIGLARSYLKCFICHRLHVNQIFILAKARTNVYYTRLLCTHPQ